MRLPSLRTIGLLMAAVAVAAYLVLAPGGSNDTTAGSGDQSATSSSSPRSDVASPQLPDKQAKPLVQRMLDQLRSGRRVTPQTDNPVAGAAAKVVPAAQGGLLVLGRLRIPAIGLNTLYREGVHSEALNDGPGHWPGTPYPGQRGNAVLSGHRTGWTHPFYQLDALHRGDPLRVTLGDNAVTYHVTSTSILAEREYVRFVLGQPRRPNQRILTMFACNPIGSQAQRIVVQARASALPKTAAGG